MGQGLRLAILIDARLEHPGQTPTLQRLRELLENEQIPHALVAPASDDGPHWRAVGAVDTIYAGAWPVYQGPGDNPLRWFPTLDGNASAPTLDGQRGHTYALDLSDRCMGDPRRWTPDEWLQYLMDAFDQLDDEAQHSARSLALLLHPEFSGRAGSIAAFRQFLRYVAERDGVRWVAPDQADMEG
ncbi:MAG: hypothetical protein KDI37_08970 [Xanthomonadales bacterium]|nr:hypothetical protein [Xanthomonadales bacterium]MCB1641850.1 hypothetical protein [Xanthomonadales bacterium]